ncbi:hypothetical protein DFJ74DRAFT_713069 [Hyaloraphidium curvatum]|nr:hypothetical protein DFJ74DRAFT_713069 [Hyaloraphidium curvatum]
MAQGPQHPVTDADATVPVILTTLPMLASMLAGTSASTSDAPTLEPPGGRAHITLVDMNWGGVEGRRRLEELAQVVEEESDDDEEEESDDDEEEESDDDSIGSP